MELSLFDWGIIISVLLLFLFIGLRYKNEGSKSLESFFLGGRNLPWYIAGTSMVATTFAADTPLAVTELVSKNGISGNWIWWCFLTGGILTTFFFAPLWQRAGVLTELELISIRYSGKAAHYLRLFKSVYLGVFMNAMIIGWVNLAFMSLIQVFFGLTFYEALGVTFLTMIIAVIYSSLSGLLGVAITDVIQFIFAMVGCIILAFVVINSEEVGGIQNIKNSLPNEYFNFFPKFQFENSSALNLSLTVGTFFSFFAVQWWASWYPGAEPGGGGYIAQRIMSTKSQKDAVYATLFFQIAHYAIRPWPWILVALAAVFLYGGFLENGEVELVNQFKENPRLGFVFTMKQFLPTGLKGVLLTAFIAAYLSTISTQLNWGASFIVNDFAKPLGWLKSNQILISRIVTFLLMIIGLAVTTVINSISGVWEFIINCGAGLGLVLILRWYWWRVNAYSEIVAMLAPFAGYLIGLTILEPYFGEEFITQNGTFLFTVMFTTLAWITSTFVSKPTDQKILEEFYKNVKPKGVWKHVNLTHQNKGLGNLLVSWTSGVSAVYSALFIVGYFLLGDYKAALIATIVFIISFFMLGKKLKQGELV